MFSLADQLPSADPLLIALGLLAFAILLYCFPRPPLKTQGIKSLPFTDPPLRALLTGSIGNLPALHTRHGNLLGVSFLFESAVLVGGPANVRAVLTADTSQLKVDLPQGMGTLLGPENLMMMHGSAHARGRRLLGPFFSPTNVRAFIPHVSQLAADMAEEWASAAGGSVSGYLEVRRYVIRVAMRVLLGLDGKGGSAEADFSKVSRLYKDLWGGFFTLPLNFPGSPYRRALNARDELQQIIAEALLQLQAPLDASQAKDSAIKTAGRTALQILSQATEDDGSPVGKERVAALITSLLLGAIDTGATALMLAIRRLALHPEVLARARDEQTAVVTQHGAEWTDDALRAMRYCEAILKETFRLQSPSKILFRRAVQDIEIEGVAIPKGQKILVHLYDSIMKDERWRGTPDVEAFKPERWLGEEEKGGKDGRGWVPFGGGQRLCPGQLLAMMEMKIMLAVLVRGYAFELADPGEKWKEFPLMAPAHGMPLVVRRLQAGKK